jgi:hypothetical protein
LYHGLTGTYCYECLDDAHCASGQCNRSAGADAACATCESETPGCVACAEPGLSCTECDEGMTLSSAGACSRDLGDVLKMMAYVLVPTFGVFGAYLCASSWRRKRRVARRLKRERLQRDMDDARAARSPKIRGLGEAATTRITLRSESGRTLAQTTVRSAGTGPAPPAVVSAAIGAVRARGAHGSDIPVARVVASSAAASGLPEAASAPLRPEQGERVVRDV